MGNRGKTIQTFNFRCLNIIASNLSRKLTKRLIRSLGHCLLLASSFFMHFYAFTVCFVVAGLSM